MPTLTYPGVYIEEIPSGVHAITGVATSIAAFIGWAPSGPTDKAALVQSWSDYANLYGGLDSRSYLGYAVNHFFANGGQQAYVVRLVANAAVKTADPSVTVAAKATFTVPGAGGTAITGTAIDEGIWAQSYGLRIVNSSLTPSRFSLQVVYKSPDGSETVAELFSNLSLDDNDPQFRSVKSVINDPRTGSQIVQISTVDLTKAPPTANPPPGTAYALTAASSNDDGDVLEPGTPDFHVALNVDGSGTGVPLLDTVPIFNLLCVPGEAHVPGQPDDAIISIISRLQKYCHDNRAFYIVDCGEQDDFNSLKGGPTKLTGQHAENSAFYFPWVNAPDPLLQGRLRDFPPCGFVAGLYAATDATRGVWKAPAGIDAGLTGASGLTIVLNDLQNGTLNTQGINCLRSFPTYGNVIWGARTLHGDDALADEWKYVPIRRLALFLESSLFRGTQSVVFEPNDERLWSQIRLNVGAFLQDLFLQGAFQGTTPRQAYFVKCDAENNPQSSIDLGIVNILVGFAPLYPAEFVVIQIQQMAGQSQS
jgi:phage tail sheath protein FI